METVKNVLSWAQNFRNWFFVGIPSALSGGVWGSVTSSTSGSSTISSVASSAKWSILGVLGIILVLKLL